MDTRNLIDCAGDLIHLRSVRMSKHNSYSQEARLHSFHVSAKSGDKIQSAFTVIAASLAGVVLTKSQLEGSTVRVGMELGIGMGMGWGWDGDGRSCYQSWKRYVDRAGGEMVFWARKLVAVRQKVVEEMVMVKGGDGGVDNQGGNGVDDGDGNGGMGMEVGIDLEDVNDGIGLGRHGDGMVMAMAMDAVILWHRVVATLSLDPLMFVQTAVKAEIVNHVQNDPNEGTLIVEDKARKCILQ